MKRSIKKNAGVYAFLEASGLLENGTSEAIEQAKKQYWKDYKKKWKKEKQKECKTFEVVFSLQELKIIISGAKKYHTNPTNYIKQTALTNKQSIIDPVAIGEIRELVVSHHNTLLVLTEENELPEQIADQLLNQASELEKRVLDFFSSIK